MTTSPAWMPLARAARLLVGTAALAACAASPESAAHVLGPYEPLAPRLEKVSSRRATVSVAHPAHISVIEVATDGARLVYPNDTRGREPLPRGRHRIDFGANPLSFGPPGPGTVHTRRVCMDEPGDRSTGLGRQACGSHQAGTPAPPAAGFRHLVVFASHSFLTAAQLRDALRAHPSTTPEHVAVALAHALEDTGQDARWAAYVSGPY
ncbi:MAG TPA: hypothetical protein VF632_19825 [Longimicrobium sp.]